MQSVSDHRALCSLRLMGIPCLRSFLSNQSCRDASYVFDGRRDGGPGRRWEGGRGVECWAGEGEGGGLLLGRSWLAYDFLIAAALRTACSWESVFPHYFNIEPKLLVPGFTTSLFQQHQALGLRHPSSNNTKHWVYDILPPTTPSTGFTTSFLQQHQALGLRHPSSNNTKHWVYDILPPTTPSTGFTTSFLQQHQALDLRHPSSNNTKHWVYDIIPPTTAIAGYAIGFRKLSPGNWRTFVGAQIAVNL